MTCVSAESPRSHSPDMAAPTPPQQPSNSFPISWTSCRTALNPPLSTISKGISCINSMLLPPPSLAQCVHLLPIYAVFGQDPSQGNPQGQLQGEDEHGRDCFLEGRRHLSGIPYWSVDLPLQCPALFWAPPSRLSLGSLAAHLPICPAHRKRIAL